jgi:hypothetical protein
MAKKGKKLPDNATNHQWGKTVTIKKELYDNQPAWRFSTVDREGPFKWPINEQVELEIVNKLHQFDSMLWANIEGKQHHFLSENSLSKEAFKRLQAIKQDDEIDNLFSFHLQGRPRIIAIRHSNIAKLLWYDPEHQVAPSQKKHT